MCDEGRPEDVVIRFIWYRSKVMTDEGGPDETNNMLYLFNSNLQNIFNKMQEETFVNYVRSTRTYLMFSARRTFDICLNLDYIPYKYNSHIIGIFGPVTLLVSEVCHHNWFKLNFIYIGLHKHSKLDHKTADNQ